jgi:hypothetical protein
MARENNPIIATLHFLFPDACSLASGADAFNIWQALSERSELAFLLKLASALSDLAREGVNLDGVSRRARPLFGPFAPQQVLRPTGRAKQKLGCRAETRQRSYRPIIPVDKFFARTCRKIS